MKSRNLLHKIFLLSLSVLGIFFIVTIADVVADPHETFPGEARGVFKRDPYVQETPVGYHVIWEAEGKCEKADYTYASVPVIGAFDDIEDRDWGGGAGACVFDGVTSYCSTEVLKSYLNKPLPYYIQVGSSTCDDKDKELTSEVVEIKG